MAEKLRLAPEQVIERAIAAIQLARNYTDDVEFSTEDGGRSEIDFYAGLSKLPLKLVQPPSTFQILSATTCRTSMPPALKP